MLSIEDQLAELRKRWLEAKQKNDTKSMKIIDIRAEILKMKPVPDEEDKELEEKIKIFNE